MPTSDNPGFSNAENAKTSSDHKKALVVGINNSKVSARLETLKFAEEDAYEVYRVLRQDACGFNFVDPVLTGDKAGTHNVRTAMIRLVEERTEQDFLLFYFIGHAQPMRTKDGQSDIYLVTYDFNLEEVKVDPYAHLSLSWLRKLFFQSEGAGKTLIVLDCCYAGNMIEIRPDPTSININVNVNVREIVEQCLGSSPINYQMGRLRVILTATGHNKPAQERRMTGLLLAALQGTAPQATDHKGFVNIHSLYTYLQNQMPQEQLPNLSGDFPQTCILAYHPHLSEDQQHKALKAEKDVLINEFSKLSDQLSEVSRIITDPQFFEKQAATSSQIEVQYFDHAVSKDTSLADLQLEKITDFFKKDRVQIQDDFLLDATLKDQLGHFGFLRYEYPIYGALICFGYNPTKWLPGAYIRCTLWSGNERLGGWLDAQDYRGDLIKQFELSRDFLRRYLRLHRVMRRDTRSEELEIPLVALGEALANALVHREYSNQPSPVYLDMFDDRVEIKSPGVPPEPMTLELLEQEHTSHPRNPLIARLFYLYGYVETVGSGIQRMQRAMKDAGLPPVQFELGKDKTFKVVFSRPNQSSQHPATVFMSYAQADVTEIQYLQRQLNLRGVRAWRDVTDLPLGNSNKYEIISAIEQESDAYVIYITQQSLTSQFIWDVEIPAALNRWERDHAYNIIPILRGVTFNELDQQCAAHGLHSLKAFNGVSLSEKATAATDETFNGQFRQVAKLVLEATLALRLRRIGADRKYEPSIYLRTYEYEPPTDSLDLELDWTGLFPSKDELPSEKEWDELLFPALADVKNVLTAKTPSRKLHIFVQAHLPVAFALGYTFTASSHFTLLLEGSHGTWRTDGSASPDKPLRYQSYESSGDAQVAVMEIAVARDTAPAVRQSIPTLGLSYKRQIHFDPLGGPDYISGVKDASQALAMSHQIGRELRRLYDEEGITNVHLFAAVPASFAVMMGHQMNALGAITFYHFLEKDSLYVPVCTLGK